MEVDLVQDAHLENKKVVEQYAGISLPRNLAQTDFSHSEIALHPVLASLHAGTCSFPITAAAITLVMPITLQSINEMSMNRAKYDNVDLVSVTSLAKYAQLKSG